MSQPNSTKRHILVMDDSLTTFMAGTGISPWKLSESEALNADVEFAETEEGARHILQQWKEQGIKPDIISADFLYGHHIGPVSLYHIMNDLYKGAPEELKPAKLFVHSKSGLNEYNDHNHRTARAVMEEMGAEYCNTQEWMRVGNKYGSEREEWEDDYQPASTNCLRKYLNEHFGLDMDTKLRSEIEKKRRAEEREAVGTNISPYEAVNAACVYTDEHGKVHKSPGEEGISPSRALSSVGPEHLATAFEPKLNNYIDGGGSIDYDSIAFKDAVGGAAVGVAAFTAEEVKKYKAEGKKVILVLQHFTPADAGLLRNVDGVVLLGRGSSHLPILCRNFGIPGIFSEHGPNFRWKENKILSVKHDEEGHALVADNSGEEEAVYRERYSFTIRPGQPISIETERYSDGGGDETKTRGQLFKQAIPLQEPDPNNWCFRPLLLWARDATTMEWHRNGQPFCHGLSVKINADNAAQVKKGFSANADGIGLLRTEHMMMEEGRLEQLQRYLLSDDTAVKQDALAKLETFQHADFSAIFDEVKAAEKKNQDEQMNLLPLPVTMRLFDSKMDELLPDPANEKEVKRLAESVGLSEAAVKTKLEALLKSGERGAQFGIKNPELYKMQVRAFTQAAKEKQVKAIEVMVPMIKTPAELVEVKAMVRTAEVCKCSFGTMIETKEAVSNAASLAKGSDFFSFGTNDLTAAILGLHRDDIEAVEAWMNKNHKPNPFRTLDDSVKLAMEMTMDEARRANPKIKLSVCGDQVSGDQAAIEFCQAHDMDALSVPGNFGAVATTRIIAGQEALKAYEAVRAENTKKKLIGGIEATDINPAAMAATRARASQSQRV